MADTRKSQVSKSQRSRSQGSKSPRGESLSLKSIDRPIVALCAGKDCKKRCEFAKMYGALAKQCDIVELKCVGICSGPVVVAHAASDQPRVFARMKTKKDRRDLLRVAVDGKKPSAQLAKREVKNAKKATTIRKVRRAVA